jgi:hypothetical protein
LQAKPCMAKCPGTSLPATNLFALVRGVERAETDRNVAD